MINCSFLSQIVFVMMPGRQQFIFYMCINRIKTSDLVSPDVKINWQMLFTIILSLVFQIFVEIKTRLLKYRTRHSVNIISQSEFIKNVGINDIDKNSMSSLVNNVIIVLLICTGFVFSTLVNKMDLLKSNEYPFRYIIYFYNLFMPCTMAGIISLIYYLRHPPLTKTIFREIVNHFNF